MPEASDWMLDRLESLCAFDTTTGHEDRGLPALQSLLAELGAAVQLQPVEPGRTNVFATWSARPRLLFSTHLDTVPPYLPPHRSGGELHGRGACDAKGQVVAQLAAIRELLAAGRTDLAWLGVVGEETDSVGAIRAQALADRCTGLVAVIDGEPTDNVLATGQRGTLHLRLRAHGVSAHSGTPELGRSALWELIDWLQRLRAEPLRDDAELGPEIWNLGLLHGGAAPNVVAPDAAADLFVRTLPGCTFATAAERLKPEGAEVLRLGSCEPDRYPQLPGFPHAVVPFGSDAPRLRRLVPDRTVVLVGPGSIRLAHSPDERIDGDDLEQGVAMLRRVADALLRRAAAG
jgi:acetylornithine deacetylase